MENKIKTSSVEFLENEIYGAFISDLLDDHSVEYTIQMTMDYFNISHFRVVKAMEKLFKKENEVSRNGK